MCVERGLRTFVYQQPCINFLAELGAKAPFLMWRREWERGYSGRVGAAVEVILLEALGGGILGTGGMEAAAVEFVVEDKFGTVVVRHLSG